MSINEALKQSEINNPENWSAILRIKDAITKYRLKEIVADESSDLRYIITNK
jgi:hypothetical protein